MNKTIKPPVSPPVFRPQPVPKVLQRKEAAVQSPPAVGPKHLPAAPPVYRPQQSPRVLQAKAATGPAQSTKLSQAGPSAATNQSAIQPKMPAPSSNVVQLKGNKCVVCKHKHGSNTCTTQVTVAGIKRQCGCKSHSSKWDSGSKFNPGAGKRGRRRAALGGNE